LTGSVTVGVGAKCPVVEPVSQPEVTEIGFHFFKRGLLPSLPIGLARRSLIAHAELRNADVAKRLFISEQTVKTHLNNVFQKLGIQDRVELTVYAIRTGIIGVHERR